MHSLSDILARIRHKPMILNARRATLLEAFVDGFLCASPDGPFQAGAINGFREWLNHLPNVEPSHSFSAVLIQLVGTDELAFDEFFRRFDEFVRSNPVGITAPGDMEISWSIVNGRGEKFIERTKNGEVIDRKQVDTLPGIRITKTEF